MFASRYLLAFDEGKTEICRVLTVENVVKQLLFGFLSDCFFFFSQTDQTSAAVGEMSPLPSFREDGMELQSSDLFQQAIAKARFMLQGASTFGASGCWKK